MTMRPLERRKLINCPNEGHPRREHVVPVGALPMEKGAPSMPPLHDVVGVVVENMGCRVLLQGTKHDVPNQVPECVGTSPNGGPYSGEHLIWCHTGTPTM